MALNQRYTHNKHIALTAPRDLAGGEPVLIGAYAGVVLVDAAEGERVTVWLDGSYDVEVTGALTEGQVVYMTGSNTLTATAGESPWGIANAAKGTGAGTIEVAPLGRVAPTVASGA